MRAYEKPAVTCLKEMALTMMVHTCAQGAVNGFDCTDFHTSPHAAANTQIRFWNNLYTHLNTAELPIHSDQRLARESIQITQGSHFFKFRFLDNCSVD